MDTFVKSYFFVVILITLQFKTGSTYNVLRLDTPKSTLDMDLEYYPGAHKIIELLRRNQEDNERDNDFVFTDKPTVDEDVADANEGKFRPKQYVVYFDMPNYNNTGGGDTTPLDSWSVIWYIASFGGLIAFFMMVSCSEWCCRRHARNRCGRSSIHPSQTIPDTPPPSYDQFAPPSYESLCYGRNGEKSQFDIYVVPVHTFGTMMESSRLQEDDEPPSYLSASGNGEFYPAYPLTPSVTLLEQTLSVQANSSLHTSQSVDS